MVQGVVIENGCIVDVNPADGSVIARVPVATTDAVEAAVSKAQKAQLAWAKVPLAERIAKLRAGVQGLLPRQEELARMITTEMGKVALEAMTEAMECGDKESFLTAVEAANTPEEVEGCIIVREAHGVVSICSPWNFPAGEILLLALPALAAGNAVIVKPSEVAPLCGAMVMEPIIASLPEGLAVVLQGDGTVGEALVKHSGIAMVAMTGSSATGRKIMEACSKSLKRLVLELGGKDPMVVFADADMEKAAEDAVMWSLFNCGQVCCSIERIYVEESAKEAFEAKVVEKAKAWVAGNGADENSRLGPMVSDMQRQLVARHVEEALSDSRPETKRAKKLFQGEVRGAGAGHFFPATVLTNLGQDMLIMREETFGPVVAISTFNGQEDEAVRLANDTEYGLTACVYTGDTAKGQRVAMGIAAGQVGVNRYPMAGAPVACPWVGHRGSGFGYHSGADGWRQFSVPKSILK